MIMCMAGSGAGWDEDVVVVCAALEDHHEEPYIHHPFLQKFVQHPFTKIKYPQKRCRKF